MLERMKKLLIIGPVEYREEALTRLQEIGTTQIESAAHEAFGHGYSESLATRALATYKSMVNYRKKAEKTGIECGQCHESAAQISEEYPLLESEYKELKAARIRLRNKWDFLEPWGRFDREAFEAVAQRSGLVFQMWEAPHKTAHLLTIPDEVISRIFITQDVKREYFLTVSEQPVVVERALLVEYDSSLSEIEQKMKKNEQTQEEILMKLYRASTKTQEMLEYHLEELTKVHFGKAEAGSLVALDGSLFALRVWCPEKEYSAALQSLSDIPVDSIELAIEESDKVPTKIVNKAPVNLGDDLVKIYDPPSYKDWDPSAWVLFSFTIFFAMIMADGGYGILLVVLMLFLKWKVKSPAPSLTRFFNLTILLGSATFIYGLVTGGFFGLNLETPTFAILAPVTSFIKSFRIIDSTSADSMSKMMTLSVVVGILHIDISLILRIFRSIKDERDFLNPLINIAWISGIWFFYFWYTNDGTSNQTAADLYKTILLYHLVGVFILYAAATKSFNPGKWLAFGLLGVYNGVQFFSDVLSYIRLFALGLSGALIAQTFNGMAMDVWNIGAWAIPFAILVFILGHTLNIGLCIMGGVIHGLRLNFLEWYRWTFEGGGRLFEPFRNLLSKDSSE